MGRTDRRANFLDFLTRQAGRTVNCSPPPKSPETAVQTIALAAGDTDLEVAAKAVKSALPAWAQGYPSHGQKRQIVAFADVLGKTLSESQQAAVAAIRSASDQGVLAGAPTSH